MGIAGILALRLVRTWGMRPVAVTQVLEDTPKTIRMTVNDPPFPLVLVTFADDPGHSYAYRASRWRPRVRDQIVTERGPHRALWTGRRAVLVTRVDRFR